MKIFPFLLLCATLRAAAPDGAALYQANCAVCHESKADPRTPTRQALAGMSPYVILQSLNSGTMKVHAAKLTDDERTALAAFVSGRVTAAPAVDAAQTGLCAEGAKPFSAAGPSWNGWGVDLANTRFQPNPGLAAADVPRLKVKWAFGFPGARSAVGQPTIVGGRLFLGSQRGAVYSLDAATGCTYWSFQASPAGVRTAITVANGAAFFGDLQANVYSVDAATGKLRWKVKVDDHPVARVTGAPALHDGRLYVPVSSVEEVTGTNPKYECCKFRGSVVALDASTGKQIWKSYTISGESKPTRQNSVGTQMYGPAGAAVWASPTLDLKRKALYVGTGNSYTDPDGGTSDSILAFHMETGQLLWTRQVTPKDWFLVNCGGRKENCPAEVGPDFDFGSSPILRTLPGGRDVLIAGQKSGVVYAMDPGRGGEILWQTRVGRGTALGGVEWGMAADARAAYAANSDVIGPPEKAGGLWALQLSTGEKLWNTPAAKLTCAPGRGCNGAQSAAVTAIPGIVFSGSIDGHLRAFAAGDGAIVWDYNTAVEFPTVNGVKGEGGSLDGPGPTLAGGMLFANSGYGQFTGKAGNVLLAFSVDGK